MSRKHVTAVNLTATCDADMLFVDVFCGYSARCHDSRVFNESPLKAKIEAGVIPPQFHLVGDAAYGLHINIMTPLTARLNQEIPPEAERYNQLQSSTRMVIERTFGMLKGRWRRLGTLENRIDNVNDAILSCCILHNMCVRNGDIAPAPIPDNLFGAVVLAGATAAEKRQSIVQFLAE